MYSSHKFNCHTFRNEATIMAELKSLKDLTNTKATATTRTSAGFGDILPYALIRLNLKAHGWSQT